MNETKIVQAITYLTDAINQLKKEMVALRTEVKRLSRAVDDATGVAASADARAAIDNDRIDKFKAYQEGKVKDAS